MRQVHFPSNYFFQIINTKYFSFRDYAWADEEVTTLKDVGNFLSTTAPLQNCIKQKGQEGANDLLNQFFSK